MMRRVFAQAPAAVLRAPQFAGAAAVQLRPVSIKSGTTATGAVYDDRDAVLASVKEYYGKVLQDSNDLQTNACTACGRLPPAVARALSKVPDAVISKFYGCGNPVPEGIDGLTVLDLGSGSGRDCYVAALFSGKQGKVIGVDMTEEQLATARDAQRNPDAAPLEFLQGYIEDIEGAGVAPASVDMCISNCVVNLSPNKRLVLEGVFKALKEGGEFYFSDVYCDRRMPESVRTHEVLFGECIAGALYINDFIALCKAVGFADPRQVSSSPMKLGNRKLEAAVGPAKFHSITYRLVKHSALEPACEDYGQVATYLGTLPYAEHRYALDQCHLFETGRPKLVCGNTAAMLQGTWLAKHFRVTGDMSTHFGAFDCGTGGSCATGCGEAGGSGGGCSDGGCGEGSAGGCC